MASKFPTNPPKSNVNTKEMTVSEIKEKLQLLEKEGFGDLRIKNVAGIRTQGCGDFAECFIVYTNTVHPFHQPAPPPPPPKKC